MIPAHRAPIWGTVSNYPGALAWATLLTNGYPWAKISFWAGNEWVYRTGPSAGAYERGAGFGISYPSSGIVSLPGGAGTNVYAAEIAVDSAWSHFNEF